MSRKKSPQKQAYQDAQGSQSRSQDRLFLEFVNDGMTRQELESNIRRRPELWGKYAHWLSRLPDGRDVH